MELKEAIALLTRDNGAVKDLRDLAILTTFQVPAMEKLFKTNLNVENGGKLGWIGDVENVGWANAAGCNPEYRSVAQAFAEKEWTLGEWAVPLKWCYEDLMNTIAEYCLKQGTKIGDLTETDYLDVVFKPAFIKAMTKMYHRLAFFGDTAAKNVTDGGNITDGIDPELFKVCDGIFKHIFALGTASPAQRVTIAANAEATTALQRSALLAQGVAIGIFDSIIDNADPRIAGMDGAAIFCTNSLAHALTKDVMNKFHEQLVWSQVESGIEGVEVGGMKETMYLGYKVISIPEWDRMIAEFENNGTKLNLPHRAYFGAPDNILVGTPADKIMSDIEFWFNQDERTTKEYASGRIGTLLGEDNLFHVAY